MNTLELLLTDEELSGVSNALQESYNIEVALLFTLAVIVVSALFLGIGKFLDSFRDPK